MRRFAGLCLFLSTNVAWAQTPPAPSFDDDLWAELDRMPPRASMELAFTVGFGDITYWRAEVPPWLIFGVRGGWGAHVGVDRQQRVGFSVASTLEGPFPEFYSVALEPSATWDRVHEGLWLGASVGPSLMLHSRSTVAGPDMSLGLSEHAAVRVGWSQAYSRVARRTFIGVEPKIRAVSGDLNWSVGLVVGSTRGY